MSNTLDRLRETPDRLDALEKRVATIESKLELLASTVIKLYAQILGIPIIEKDQQEAALQQQIEATTSTLSVPMPYFP